HSSHPQSKKKKSFKRSSPDNYHFRTSTFSFHTTFKAAMAAKPPIVVYACPCLNIKIHLARRYLPDTHSEDRHACHVEETLSVQDPADPEDRADDKKKPEGSTTALVVKGYRFELGMGGIAVEHKHLSRMFRPTPRWTTVRCLNCRTDVYGFAIESDGAAAPYYPPDTYQLSPENGKVVVLEGALWGDQFEEIGNSEEYSDAFRIVIRAQKEEKGKETIGEADTVIPELQTVQTLLQQTLDASLSIQRQQTESRVQQYHQQQLALLELTQQKAREDKDRLWRRIKSVAVTVPPTLQSRQTPSRQWSFKSNDPGPSPILTTKASSSSLSSHTATVSPRVAGSHHHVHFEDTVVSPTVAPFHVVHGSSSDPHPQFRRSPPPRHSAPLSSRENPEASSSSKSPAVTAEISRVSSASSFASIGSSPSTRSRSVVPAPVIPTHVAAPPSLTTGYVASVGRVGPVQSVGRRPNFVMDEAEIVASYKDTGAWGMVAEGTGAVDAKGKGKGKAVDGKLYEDKMEQRGRSRELFEEDQMFELDEDVGEEFEEVEVVEDEEDAAEGEAEAEAEAEAEVEAEAEAEVEAEGKAEKAEKAAVQETVAEVAKKAESEVGSKALMGEVTKEETAGTKHRKTRANGLVAKEREASGEKKRTRRVVKKKVVRKYVPEIEDEEGDEVFDQEGDDSEVAMSLPAGARFTNATATSASLTNYATSVPIAIIRTPAQRPAASTTTTTMTTTTTAESSGLSSTYGRYGASVVQPSVMVNVTRDELRYDVDDDEDAGGPMVPPHVLAARTYTDETEVLFGAVPRSAKWSLSGI
ncbi:hypothetical protein BC937DRAFT_94080, partial [Endogone sp. FLAS-F59071]